MRPNELVDNMLWVHGLRSLKTDPFKREDLDEFVRCYNPENRHNRKATWGEKLDSGSEAGMTAKGKKKGVPEPVHPSTGSGRPGLDDSGRTGPEGPWRAYDYKELINRDKASLDIFWCFVTTSRSQE